MCFLLSFLLLLYHFADLLGEYIGVLNNCTVPIELLTDRKEHTTLYQSVMLAAGERTESTDIPTQGSIDFVITKFGDLPRILGSVESGFEHSGARFYLPRNEAGRLDAAFDIHFKYFEMPISITAEKDIFYNVPSLNKTIRCMDKNCKPKDFLGKTQNPYGAAGRGNFNITICA